MNYTPDKSLTMYSAATKAIAMAKKNKKSVTFVFNDIEITAKPASFHGDLMTIFDLKCELVRAQNR